jgi:hypothetical protein
MKTLSHRTYALIAIALAVVLFLAVNIVSNQWFGTARADLTQNGLYTVSPGTAATLSKLEEPITLRFYFSRQPAAAYAGSSLMPDGFAICCRNTRRSPTTSLLSRRSIPHRSRRPKTTPSRKD